MRTLLLTLALAGCTVQTVERDDPAERGRMQAQKIEQVDYRDPQRPVEIGQVIELVPMRFGGQSGEPGPPDEGLGNTPTNPSTPPPPDTTPATPPPAHDHFMDADNDGIPDNVDPDISLGADTSDTGDTDP